MVKVWEALKHFCKVDTRRAGHTVGSAMRRIQYGLFLCITCLDVAPLSAQSLQSVVESEQRLFWVGIASFRNHESAVRLRETVQGKFAQGVSVQRHPTAGGEFYRVLAGPITRQDDARAQVRQARADGFTSAWLVIASGSDLAAVSDPKSHLLEVAEHAQPVQLRQEQQAQHVEKQDRKPPAKQVASSDQATPRRPSQTHSLLGPDASEQAVPSTTALAPTDLRITLGTGQAMNLQRVARDDIKVDGFVDEAQWLKVTPIDDFRVIEPDTLIPGIHETLMRVVYSDKGIYVGAIMRQPQETLVRRLSGRDARDNRDSLSFTIDTSGEGRYGYWFGINLGDSLMDGTVLPERTFTSDWDGPWYARSQKLDDGWSAEMFIPWGIVTMPASGELRTMGMYASRKVAYLDERWGWPALPPTQPKFMSALQSAQLEGVQPRQQYNIYPFLATGQDFVDDVTRHRVGADFFWRPSSNFQMNATLNPDFGNVESDEVVINLTATETFFPEKRLFFLEGQEIFVASPRADTRGRGVGNQGLPYTMVNTRRIGGRPRVPNLAPGVDIEERELVAPTELIGAVKTTGQLGRVRYGVMGAFEEEVKFDVVDNGEDLNLNQAGNDYGVARVLYEDNVGGAYRAVGFLSTAVLNEELGDALVQGIDWHYLSPAGGVKIDGQVMTSDLDRIDGRGYGGFLDFQFTYAQGLVHRVGLEYFDERIDINDLGFLQRNDEYRVRSALQWTRSDLSWARENQFDVRGFVQKNISESLLTGGGIFFSNRTNLNDLSQFTWRLNYNFSYFDDLNSFGNGSFRIEDRLSLEASWQTDTTRQWSFFMGAGYREDDLGDPGFRLDSGLVWRPNDQLSVELAVDYVERDAWLLHQDDGLFATFEAQQWLPSLSFEYFISARQQFRLALQWVGVKARERDFFRVPANPGSLIPVAKPTGPGTRENFDFGVSQYSLQARYRWEIAPLSDIFLVYTRQADLRTALGDSGFTDLFDDAFGDPLADVLVFKIRYRFGS